MNRTIFGKRPTKIIGIAGVIGILALGACSQKPPTLAEAQRAFARIYINNPMAPDDLKLGSPLAKTFQFIPKSLVSLSNCKPASGQPGNVCDFAVTGTLYKPMGWNTGPENIPATMTAKSRFFQEKDGSWKMFTSTPISLSLAGETCAGVSDCHVSYPLRSDMGNLIMSKNIHRWMYRRIMGESDWFDIKTVNNISCAPKFDAYNCTATMTGIMEHRPEGFFFGGRPKSKFVKETHTIRFLYVQIFGKGSILLLPPKNSL